MCRSRKPVYRQRYRGFESLPLRLFLLCFVRFLSLGKNFGTLAVSFQSNPLPSTSLNGRGGDFQENRAGTRAGAESPIRNFRVPLIETLVIHRMTFQRATSTVDASQRNRSLHSPGVLPETDYGASRNRNRDRKNVAIRNVLRWASNTEANSDCCT